MVFKGVLIKSNIGSQTNTYNDVPVSDYSAGWTYRVAEAGTYVSNILCEVGDFIVATTDASTNQTSINPNHWAVIQTNVKGTVTLTINGVEYQLSTNTNQDKP
jgi:hypothetical protein